MFSFEMGNRRIRAAARREMKVDVLNEIKNLTWEKLTHYALSA